GNQHPGRADTALRRAMLEEGFLQTIKSRRRFVQALDRDDFCAGQLADRGQTRADRIAIDEDGAGTAITGIATDLRSGEMKFLAQDIREPGTGIGRNGDDLAVERNLQ